MLKSFDYWIEKLQLQPHPEGGYFNEIYRSAETVSSDSLPERYNTEHSFSTSIYFLLKSGQCSKFHRLQSDEIWHFYYGSPVRLYQISPEGNYSELLLGNDPEKRHDLQLVIKAGSWFAAEPVERESYSLVGCTVAPGFDFNDFELGNREQLLKLFPVHKEIIEKLS